VHNVFRIGAVTGRILSTEGEPAAGIPVNAITAEQSSQSADGDRGVSYSAKTSSSGHYRLDGIPEGRYYVTAGLIGFPTYYPGVSQIMSAAVVSVRVGETAPNTDFALAIPLEGLRVSGRVIRPTSQEAPPSEQVVLAGPGEKPTAPFNIPFRQESAVHSDGSFEFFVLRAGTYALSVTSGILVQPVSVVVADKDVVGIQLRPHRTVDITGVVNLEAGRMQPALNVSSPSPRVHVTGRVIDRRGPSSISPSKVVLSGAAETLEAGVDGEGSFEFPMVLPGRYVLKAAKPPGPPDSELDGFEDPFQKTPVEVGNRNVSGIELVLRAMSAVRARVVVEDGGPIIPGGFRFSATVSSGRRITPGWMGPWPDGTLQLWLPEGEYRLSVDLRGEYALKSLTWGSTDLLIQPLKISASSSRDLEIQLTLRLTKSAKVRGRVRAPGLRGETAAPYKMSAYRAGALVEWYSIVSNVDGTFETTVIPGVYTLSVQTKSPDRTVHAPGAPRLSTLPFQVAGRDVSGIEINLPRWKEVRGRLILEDDGPPLASATLSLTGDSVSTHVIIAPGPDGTFSATLPEGEYWCSVQGFADGYAVTSLTYGSTNLFTERLRVSAADDAELHVRFVVTPQARMVKVSGRVVRSGVGARIAAVDSRAARTGRISIAGWTKQDALLNPDGSFEFLQVTPGWYRLQFDLGMYSATISGVRVPHEGLTSLTLLAASGHVIVEEGGSLPSSLFITAKHESIDDENYKPQIRLNADGSFTLLLVPGDQWISCLASQPFYMAQSMYYGSTDVLHNRLRIESTDSPLELVITLGRRFVT
jgi:carboxypeptidase family protein